MEVAHSSSGGSSCCTDALSELETQQEKQQGKPLEAGGKIWFQYGACGPGLQITWTSSSIRAVSPRSAAPPASVAFIIRARVSPIPRVCDQHADGLSYKWAQSTS